MPGTHAISHCRGEDGRRRLLAALADQKSDPLLAPEILWEAPDHAVAFSGHSSYPREILQKGGARILLEGAVYNLAEAERQDRLRELADLWESGADVREAVRGFMQAADGDYLVVLRGEKRPGMAVFNDRGGRLPAYCYRGQDVVGVSRSLGFLLHFLPQIRFDRLAIAEFLMMGYVLGTKTLVQGVAKLEPGSLLQTAAVDGQTRSQLDRLVSVAFGHDPRIGEAEAAARCGNLFIRGLEDRVRFCRERGYRMTVDVTAGRDSRANYVGLCRLGAPMDCFSDDLDTHNECSYLPALEEIYGRCVFRVPLRTPAADFDAMRRLTYCTDCTVNAWTAYLAEYKTLGRKQLVGPAPAVRFMGFGGEFIRTVFHPPFLYNDMSRLIRDSVYFHIFDLADACRILNLRKRELAAEVERYVASYPEADLADRLKHFYFEYYNVLVSAGENRQRRHYWTVSPLWSLDLLDYEMAELPPDMLNHAFFDRFLEQVEPRATQAPFYRRGADAGTRASIAKYHFLNRLRRLTSGWPFLVWRRKLKRILGGEYRRAAAQNPLDLEILRAWESTPIAANYLSGREIRRIVRRRSNPVKKHQLLAVLHFLEEIGRRFPVGPADGAAGGTD